MTTLTTAQVAEQLQMSPKRVRELVRAGRLRASRPGGGEYRIEQDAVTELLSSTRVEPDEHDQRTFRSRAAPAPPPAPAARGRAGSFRARATRRSEAA